MDRPGPPSQSPGCLALKLLMIPIQLTHANVSAQLFHVTLSAKIAPFLWGSPINSRGVLSVQGFYLVWFGQAGFLPHHKWVFACSPRVERSRLRQGFRGLGRLLDLLSQQ